MNEKEIIALTTLLGDDDIKIKEIARKKLLEFSDFAKPILKKVGSTDTEGKVRIEAQSLLEEMRLDKLAENFRSLKTQSILDLEKACFVLAEIEYPDLDIAYYERQIEQLAMTAEKRIHGIADERKKVLIINHLLFDEKEFAGNVDDYYDPENSYINRVLDRGLGIPISLSTIYLFIARRINLVIHGVGFPGHFMLKYKDGANWVFVDSFNRGKILTRHDCEVFLSKNGFQFEQSFTTAMRPRDILARMIRNLMLIYHQNDQQKKSDTLEKIFSDFVMA